MNAPATFEKSPSQTEPHERLWTREEYDKLVAENFFLNERVELIWGRIIKMPPMLSNHAMGINLAEIALEAAFGQGFMVRTQQPLNLPNVSAPEPDLAVVPGGPRDYPDHPTSALLVVEVSDSTLRHDRNVKVPLYASASLQEYWIVNLVDKQLEVYRDPQPDTANPENSKYGKLIALEPDDTVSPLAAPGSQIKVSNLLP